MRASFDSSFISFAIIVLLLMGAAQLFVGNTSLAQDSTSNTIVIHNNGTSAMEGHTPRGFQGMGTGLFVGDNLNPNFPNGDGVQTFLTFDLSEVPQNQIASATLRSRHVRFVGTPFADLGAMTAEEIRYDAFSSALWDLPALEDGASCVFATSLDEPFECDVTAVVQNSLDDGYEFAQFRLLFDEAGDSDGEQDMVFFFITNPNMNEAGIFELEITLAAQNADVDLSTGLVAHFLFDGDANDVVTGAMGDVMSATFVEDRFGNPESALRLNAGGDFVEVGHRDEFNLTEQMTFSFWLFYEPQPAGPFYTIFEKTGTPADDGHARYGAWIIRDRVEVCIEPAMNAPRIGPQSCLDSEIPLEEGAWNHVAATYDGEQLTIFINGESAGNRAFEPSAISTNDSPIFIGTDLFGRRPVFLRGTLDDLRIYDRAFTHEEILALFELPAD